MKHFLIIVSAAIAGLVVWFVVATVGDLGLRAAWPGYDEARAGFTFTVGMLVARLVLGAICSVAAGYAAARIAGARRGAWVALTVLLLILFLPQHARLWSTFPIWYHATFIASLLILPFAGARMRRPASSRQRVAREPAALNR